MNCGACGKCDACHQDGYEGELADMRASTSPLGTSAHVREQLVASIFAKAAGYRWARAAAYELLLIVSRAA